MKTNRSTEPNTGGFILCGQSSQTYVSGKYLPFIRVSLLVCRISFSAQLRDNCPLPCDTIVGSMLDSSLTLTTLASLDVSRSFIHISSILLLRNIALYRGKKKTKRG